MVDNYEFIYIFALCVTRLFRQVSVILDYEDGKHLSDRSWSRVLSSVAEWVGRFQVSAAVVAHPALARRLPPGVPSALVPGFVVMNSNPASCLRTNEIRFLYSGSLDRTRGVDLLLDALRYLPSDGWRLDISGAGPLEPEVISAISASTHREKLKFHGALPNAAFAEMVTQCHVGINCQRCSDPISSVTFPSKIFTYLSAGLLVISSRASEVPAICGDACIYFSDESPEALAQTLTRVIKDYGDLKSKGKGAVEAKYSPESTALRLRELFQNARLS